MPIRSFLQTKFYFKIKRRMVNVLTTGDFNIDYIIKIQTYVQTIRTY